MSLEYCENKDSQCGSKLFNINIFLKMNELIDYERRRGYKTTMIRYVIPKNWINYDGNQIFSELTEAKAAVMSLTTIPFQRSWADALQDLQLKREVAGTSRIEGAEFTESELDAALKENAEHLFTRSQRQARAAKLTYQWIADLPDDRPINRELILEVHRRIITGADDDHCPPGRIRGKDENVLFGAPRHRGAEGGEECEKAFSRLDEAIQREFKGHDVLIQALSLHYHFAAIHPFLDGNGRTARAIEALFLQRAGLRDSLFIAMSNYYYDEKAAYLNALSESRGRDHDLTPFLKFGLRGISVQCRRLSSEIQRQVYKALFRNVMYDLFDRLQSTRKRVIARRQMQILKLLLEVDEIEFSALHKKVLPSYESLKLANNAFVRDMGSLFHLGAIHARPRSDGRGFIISLNLEWPTQITESSFFERIQNLPKARTYPFQ
ncbi:MAG: Fic family protein [Blastocatellia bacterium]|nr:Fic family protein [Blastocatellia bacterium]